MRRRDDKQVVDGPRLSDCREGVEDLYEDTRIAFLEIPAKSSLFGRIRRGGENLSSVNSHVRISTAESTDVREKCSSLGWLEEKW